MREISEKEISDAVRELFIDANYRLPDDARRLICDCAESERNTLAKSILETIDNNIEAARELDIPICQDTGMAVLFADIGCDVHINGDFERAVNDGVRRAYADGYLRKSVVRFPMYERVNTDDNTPAVIHIRLVPGDKLHLTAAPKGFGSENMSAVKMFTPSATESDIIEFVKDTVKRAGSNPCPPIVVGVGIGGTFEYAALLAKRALTRDVSSSNADPRFKSLEEKMLAEINTLDIGPQGFGGDTTALAVNIETYPTHIAGLPVAVNINCHVARHKEMTL
ncbi:MAG: fumarate hydratase [Clostridia bacterium]|nr:fumarate hydratase [Clostridia bacterium]